MTPHIRRARIAVSVSRPVVLPFERPSGYLRCFSSRISSLSNPVSVSSEGDTQMRPGSQRPGDEKESVLGHKIRQMRERSTSSKNVIRLCNEYKAQLTPADALRLVNAAASSKDFKQSAPSSKDFIERIADSLRFSDARSVYHLFLRLSRLKSGRGIRLTLPHLQENLQNYTAKELVEIIWALQNVGMTSVKFEAFLDMVMIRLGTEETRDSLDTLFLYRALFGLQKMDIRTEVAKKFYILMSTRVRREIQAGERAPYKLTPKHLVRLAWAFGRLHLRDPNLFADFAAALKPVVEELEEEQLSCIKNVFETLEFL
uniref:Uncharacterized protein n=1 Tax=Chromera velia CCMP2878 TaxID=1169474 RepID=A0A0G4I067_9ALVE|eukprot:Cvel_34290.t1-p1 / transcript=Cvel_34290.t1 / gene=Cvel_34290 / organism=Chromera_velia_CCMP2878 / gene_product=hypothetical protein / transcript_product=hypothetical protein / location=Cvel_scaffold5830:1024-3075(+) / protein_length=314 / sequence_SO=supercontig / SO=protein_coding / is_pseudo=false